MVCKLFDKMCKIKVSKKLLNDHLDELVTYLTVTRLLEMRCMNIRMEDDKILDLEKKRKIILYLKQKDNKILKMT